MSGKYRKPSLGGDFLICKAGSELCEFIKPISERLDRPRKKFLRQVIGFLTSRFRKQVPFIYERLLDGLWESGRLRYPYRDTLLPKLIENG